MLTKVKATLDDLYQLPDHQKAELVNGEIVFLMPTRDEPGYAGDEISRLYANMQNAPASVEP